MSSGEATIEEQEAFDAWLQSNPHHREAYTAVESFWHSFDGLEPQGARSALQDLPSRKSIAKNAKTYLSIAIAITSISALVNSSLGDYYLADYSTATGEMRDIVLNDGSRIKMNTGTAIDVAYSGHQRLIKLRKGEILVSVSKNKDRPFIVETSHGSAVALGTEYQVKNLLGSTSVAVIESNVRVCSTPGYFSRSQPECLNLEPGMGVPEIKSGMQAIPVNLDALSAWANGYITFESIPLSAVLQELDRYTPGKIYFDADAISDLQVSGVVPIIDMDKAYAMLAKLLPITIEQYPYLAVVKRKHDMQPEK